MHFGFLRHAIGTNWRDLCTTLHIMRAQWWPCAQLFPVPLLGKPFLGREHGLVFPVFNRRPVSSLIFASWISSAPLPPSLSRLVSCLILLFGDSLFSVTRLSWFCAIPVLYCVFEYCQRLASGPKAGLPAQRGLVAISNFHRPRRRVVEVHCVFFPDVSWHFMI